MPKGLQATSALRPMFTKKELNQIKKEIEEFFRQIDFPMEFDVSLKDETLLIKAKTEEPRILIGERGKILMQIQHLLRSLLNRKLQRIFYIDLDINDYKLKKTQYLKEVAKEIADQVALAGKERILFPMPAYERRIIHLELAERSDITTESIGDEPDRRIVIKPYP